MKKTKLKIGKCQPLWKCCREIRIQCPSKLDEIYNGFNTITESKEYWRIKKINKDRNFTIMERVYPEN